MATSSARYIDLYDYADKARRIDHDLVNQADRLSNRLNHFEATCREPGFQVSSDSLGPAMRSYGMHCEPIDRHVQVVGEAFQRADRRSGTFWGRLAKFPGTRWLVRVLRPGRVRTGQVLGTTTYKVKPGDTLSGIAKQYGVTVDELVQTNDIADRNLINPGQSLTIPGQTPDTPAPTPIPVPFPVPTPTRPPMLTDIVKDKPSWIGEQVDRFKKWLAGLPIGAKPQPPAKKPPIITNSQPIVIEKPQPPVAKIPSVPVAESVPTNDYNPKYGRGEGARKSNCTWYAAMALTTFVKWDPNPMETYPMGDAVDWLANAENAIKQEAHPLHGYISSVDKKPAAGAVLYFNTDPASMKENVISSLGHVAWVEKAELVTGTDGKKEWKITISEEAYTGGNWKGSTVVETGDPTVKRWRRTITYPADENDENKVNTGAFEFIHPDPEYQKPQ
jgi:surface antigen